LYSFTKAGLNMMTRAWATEFGPHGVRVNAIAPGLIQTDFSEFFWKNEAYVKHLESTQPIRRIGQPREIGHLALYLASDEASYVPGQVSVGAGGARFWRGCRSRLGAGGRPKPQAANSLPFPSAAHNPHIRYTAILRAGLGGWDAPRAAGAPP